MCFLEEFMATQQTEERKTSRDEFSQDIKKRLSERVGLHCSNPDCDIITKAPSSESNSSVNNIGVAAHICAAASGKGARRYKPSMTPEERSSIENGIWLCCNCSVKIDRDEKTYTEELLQNWKSYAENKALKRFGNKVYSKEEIDEIIDDYEKKHQLDAEQIKSLTVAITALVQGKTHATPSQIDAAFAALRKGDSSLALRYFEEEDARRDEEANDKLRAEIKRNIGALAFQNDTQKSQKAYRRATQLDPDNADGWNQLGLLLHRIGQFDESIDAYKVVFHLGQKNNNQKQIVVASENIANTLIRQGEKIDFALSIIEYSLGICKAMGFKEDEANHYSIFGNFFHAKKDLKESIKFHTKSLHLNVSLSRIDYMAGDFNNLGMVYKSLGSIEMAIASYGESLKINRILNNKESIAINCRNLGISHEIKKEFDKAREYWKESASIYKALGSPMAKQVQSWLDSLPQ